MSIAKTSHSSSGAPAELPSVIFIKTPKCASGSVASMLSAFCDANHKTRLTLANDSIFEARDKIYDMSLNHVPFERRYMEHLRSLMRGDDVLFLSCVREPLSRSVSHYYYSNQLRYEIDYNVWYQGNFAKDPVSAGWFLPLKEMVNNQMAWYMGFHSEAEISLRNLRSRYRFVFVAERMKESLWTFREMFPMFRDYRLERINVGDCSFRESDVNGETRRLFLENNALDYKLYRLCNQILDELMAGLDSGRRSEGSSRRRFS